MNLSMWPIILGLSIFVLIIGITLYITCRDMWKTQFTLEAQEVEEWWKSQKDDMNTDLRKKDESK